MPAKKDPFKRTIRNFRLRPWLQDLDVTWLARDLEAWSLQVLELERNPDQEPPQELVQEIGQTVIRRLQEGMELRERSYRPAKGTPKKR